MALSSVGLTNDDLIRMDKDHSLDNSLLYDNERYLYANSYEVFRFEDDADDSHGFYMWEFFTERRQKVMAVVKWEGLPFEVYASEKVSLDRVTVFKNKE